MAPIGRPTIPPFSEGIAVIRILEGRGIVRELMPEHDGYGGSIWSWEVLKPEELPDIPWLQAMLILYNGKLVL